MPREVTSIIRGAGVWAFGPRDAPSRCVTTRDLVIWAFVNDPTAWNEVTRRIGGIHPEEAVLPVEEPVSPDSTTKGLGFPISVEVSAAADLAETLIQHFALSTDPSTVALAAALIGTGYAGEWATQKLDLFDAAAELSTALLGAPLAGLTDFVDLSGGPSERVRPITAREARRRYKGSWIGTLAGVLILHYVFGVQLFLSVMVAFTATVALPELTSIQSRRRLAVTEIVSIGVVAALAVLALGSVGPAVDEARALSKLAAAGRLEQRGLYRQALDDALPLDARLLTVPRLHILVACAAYAEGFKDYALVHVQLALLYGADSATAPAFPNCFLNQDLTEQLFFIDDPFGTLLVAPATDPSHWRAKAEGLLRSGHYDDALVSLACAEDVAGARDTAALDLTLGTNRLPINRRAADPLGDVIAGKVRGVAASTRVCLRQIGASDHYQLTWAHGQLIIRPVDYQKRTP